MEHDRGALPGNAVLPVIVGGVHRRAAEQTSDGAGSIRTIISNATPDRRGANVTSMVVGDERLHAQKLSNGRNVRKKENSTRLAHFWYETKKEEHITDTPVTVRMGITKILNFVT